MWVELFDIFNSPLSVLFSFSLSLEKARYRLKYCLKGQVNPKTTIPPPGADIESDHDLVMVTFRFRLKKASKPNQPRLMFDLEKWLAIFKQR